MRRLLLPCLLLTVSVSFSQNPPDGQAGPTIDSLQQALKNYDARKLELHKNLFSDESDTVRVNILNDLCWESIMVSEYTDARKYAEEAHAISQKIGFENGIAKSYNLIAIIYASQGDYTKALQNNFDALNLYEKIGDKNGIAKAYNDIGNIYAEQGNYPKSLKNHITALKIREETGNKRGIAGSYNNIGIIYKQQGNYPEALKNYYASLKIFEEIKDKYGLTFPYNNIGLVYSEQGNYPEAIRNYSVALKLCEELKDKRGIGLAYLNLGWVYSQQASYSEALNSAFASLKIFEEIGDKNNISKSYTVIGNVKVKTKNVNEGKDWLMKGLILAKEIGSVDDIKSNYESLAAADSALGNFKGAYENHKLFILYRDSLNNEENTKKTTQMQMQYEFDKKEAETKALTDAELNKQMLLRNAFVGGFAIVLLFAGVFFRQRNKTKKEKLRSDELLLNILPGEVAEEIKTSGAAKAKAYTMVTVMFTDFKDFTTMSEKISAELLVDEIHTCFCAFDNILQKYNIEKIKTIGDAYLCASGLPVSTHTHAQDMLNAAFEIRAYMLQRKKEKEAKGEIPFELRIGIHTGPVVAGVVGVKKYAYDIWGDTVNIASRMESSSEAGKINISGATYELVKNRPDVQTGKFKFEYRGKIQAKNKGEIDMYYVER